MEKIIAEVNLDLPKSITEPKPLFNSNQSATDHYTKKIEAIATLKSITVEELQLTAHNMLYDAAESFEILSLFDSVRALQILK